MLLREIVHTCSNRHVAEAALACIGGDLAIQVSANARRRQESAGAFVVRTVKSFVREANDESWEDLGDALQGSDQPILTGLRYILDRRLNGRQSAPNEILAPFSVMPDLGSGVCA